ncbi:L,D-transpeptidase family protein [uncultured Tenacibaculum sp.]|uniref:L,D-transpeptidase family protein n=1 Tax=uncultured Tenacibaculum sp. TaxID=174713 RepID=UPI0026239561|nr:L,D-transpeptidase family protein [uncultured Tenacibaculum sp.]
MIRKKTIFWIFLFIALAGLFVFFKEDSSFYQPLVAKIKGKETVKSIVEKHEKSVFEELEPNLTKIGLGTFPDKISILIFKEERKMQLLGWRNGFWYFIKEYKFTGFSGEIGPKLVEGDRQIPEGIYQIEFLNPNSSYHLSLKINYPNSFDKKKAKLDGRTKLGGDIFIHGKNVTIGCVPIGDEAVEELFVVASKAYNKGIEVIISPKDFRKDDSFPEIQSITWENELYEKIKTKLLSLPIK